MADNEQDRRQHYLGLGIALGAGTGTALGIAFGNLVMGISVGAGLGLVLGSIVGAQRADESKAPSREQFPDGSDELFWWIGGYPGEIKDFEELRSLLHRMFSLSPGSLKIQEIPRI